MEKIKDVSISEELKNSYIDYAISVIISRALPDVRDGLKPVQRRILFVMKELGLWPNEKFTKCANIVGTTLARYHPHGDQAVYDALVRMAQDFSLRYPLVWGQGNMGSIDGDPPAQMRYCITGDSLVITNRCLERIKEISQTEEIDIKVLSFNKNINKASKWFNSGIHPVFEIKTFHGYSLKATENHPILVLSKDKEGKPVFMWKLIKDIEIGDFAVIDRTEDLLWPKNNPKLFDYYPKNFSKKIHIHKLPIKLNKELAFILGFIVSEGCLIDYGSRYKKICIVNNNVDIINLLEKYLKKSFPTLNICIFKRKPVGFTKKEYYSIEICSSFIYQFLNNLGLYKTPTEKKEIPKIIFDANKETAAYFLKALFEGDGSLIFGKKNPRIDYVSKSEKLIKDLQILLLRFGIVSFIRYDRYKNYFRLTIVGKENVTKFYKKINFASPSKKEKLKKLIKIYTKKPALSLSDFIPFLSSYIKNKYKNKKIHWVYKEWLKNNNIDRYERLKKNLSILEKFLGKDDLFIIKYFLKTNYLFDRIISKEYAGKDRVYSLKVESDCHSFVANGFINHNTEAKLSKFAVEMLSDIDKETVDFRENYDNTRKEPVVLPTKIPNLVINGTMGIAVGMATNIPPHNLGEVVRGLILLLEKPEAKIDEIMQYIKGPDFPTGGQIFGIERIKEVYEKGQGSILMRGVAEVGERQIIIKEIPFGVNKAELVSKIAELALNKQIEGIKDIRDESNKEGIRIVIELKPQINGEHVLNLLYKFTDLEKNFNVNLIALDNGIQPRVFTFKELLLKFLDHRKEVVLRRTKHDLKITQERIHILEGFKIAIDNIDEILKIIKTSSEVSEAQEKLEKKFKLTPIQAKAILDMPLKNLVKLEKEKIISELNEKRKLEKEFKEIIQNPKKLKEVIKQELIDIEKKYKDERKTKIFAEIPKKLLEHELLPDLDVFVVIDENLYIKRIQPNLKTQSKGGKGVNVGVDKVFSFNFANLRDKILIFTDNGKVYQIPVYQIPEMSKQAQGKPLLSFVDIGKDEKIVKVISFKDSQFKWVIFATKNGYIKKMKVDELKNIRSSGVKVIKIDKNDSLCNVIFLEDDEDLILATKDGYGIRFSSKDVKEQKRTAGGVLGIKKRDVIGIDVVRENIILISENGYGKRLKSNMIKKQKRGGKGIRIFKVSQKTGPLSLISTKSGEEVIIITLNGQALKIKLSQIKILSRNSQGVKLISLDPGNVVKDIVVI
jgi:DNA gyrase subunit A